MVRKLAGTLVTVAILVALGIGLVLVFQGMQEARLQNPAQAPPTPTPAGGRPPTPLPPKVIYEQKPFPDPAYAGLTPQPTATPALFPGVELANETQLSPQGSLTEVGSDFDPTWSPDNSSIAFLRRFNRPDDPELWVMSSDGSGQKPIGYLSQQPGLVPRQQGACLCLRAPWDQQL